MERYSFGQFEGEVHVGLYKNVTNAGEIRRRIGEGTGGRRIGYIDASLITSRLHVQTAIYQALLAESQGVLRTRSVHTEVIWALNPTNNITEGLRRYGVSDGTTAVLVVSMDGAGEELGAGIAGTLVGLDELAGVTDYARICKYHKLSSAQRLDAIVVATVAAKSVMT